MLTLEQLQREAADSGFPSDSLEKVSRLIQLLDLATAHPFLGPRIALKGLLAVSNGKGMPGARCAGWRGRLLVGVHSPPPGRRGTVHRRGTGVIGVPR
jgi:hypothetical protein